MVEAVAGTRWGHRHQVAAATAAPQRRPSAADRAIRTRRAEATPLAAALAAPLPAAIPTETAARLRHGESAATEAATRARLRRVTARDTWVQVDYEHARQVAEDLHLRWLRVPGTDAPTSPPWWAHFPRPLAPAFDPGNPPYARVGILVGAWMQNYERPQGGAVAFDHTAAVRPHNDLVRCWHSPVLLSTRAIEEIDFAHVPMPHGRYTFGALNFGHGRGLGGPPPRERQVHARVRWGEATMRDRPNRLRWGPLTVIYGGPGPSGPGTDTSWEDDHQRIVYPRRNAYMIVNDLTCVRLPDRYPLPWLAASMRCDATQWAWTLDLMLSGPNAAGLLQPSGDDPFEIEISLNGATWIFIAETWYENRRFGNHVVQVTGRGRSAYLSDRYSLSRNYAETENRTIAQLAEQELPIGSDWEIFWEPADWAVPAGAWSYQGLSPIQAIARLAGAAGAIVYPHPSDYGLHIRPAWPVLPWNMTSGQEDLLIPQSSLLLLTRRYRHPSQADAVHIYGAEVGGVQARVYRTGTAGDDYAPDVMEPLVTHSDGALALGSRVLADLYRPCSVASLTMAIDARGDFPVPSLGDLALIDIEDGQMGPILSIEIRVDGAETVPSVRQTLGIGQANNDYRKLLELLPQEPRILAQIATAHGDNTVTCTTTGGQSLRVRGTGSPGAWVWIRGGKIETVAPTLFAYDIGV